MLLSILQKSHSIFDVQRPDILDGPIDSVGALSLLGFILGEVTGNSSWVDKSWPFLPTLYTAYFTFLPLASSAPDDIRAAGINPRTALIFTAQVIWTIRLTYNAHRRGFYNDWNHEDYRWAVLRQGVPWPLYSLFNLTFIAIAQTILLFSLSLPAYIALIQSQTLQASDWILFAVSMTTIAIEFVADNQQWSFHEFKRTGTLDDSAWPGAKLRFSQADKDRGFIANGLWSVSRHPNFICEQLFWLWNALYPVIPSLYLAPACEHRNIFTLNMTSKEALDCVAQSTADLWPVASAVALAALFQGSTIFTEVVTGRKYPRYKDYQARVGMFFPTTTWIKGVWLGVLGRKLETERNVWPDKMNSGKTE